MVRRSGAVAAWTLCGGKFGPSASSLMERLRFARWEGSSGPTEGIVRILIVGVGI